ncbi:type IV secretion system DNA-binding domain-containing protein [Vibrio diazotrophicus]|uniref:type IV secretion system DNA-binding domain-containing protein n=1 Tax=Vibrio diazotrophicus TaxID=685 RepID=UPI000C9DDF72|nr:type IV secretion system DNA-binding domain-containing protein [Vibrio diazotrophicus]PNH80069.1 hypothetical protein C1N27_11040 [Vibrio diazotrophicus]
MSNLKNKYQCWWLIISLCTWIPLLMSLFTIRLIWGKFYNIGQIEQHVQIIFNSFILLFNGVSTGVTNYFELFISRDYIFSYFVQVFMPVLFSYLFCFLFAKKYVYVDGGRDNAIHISGPKLYHGSKALRHANFMLFKSRQCKTIKIHPQVYLNKTIESGNLLIIGAQGSGKSTVTFPIVDEIIKNNNSILIYDAKREYTEKFYRQGVGLLSPTDSRSLVWDISSDITSENDALTIANCLIEDSSKEPHWTNGARLILSGCIVSLMRTKRIWDWMDLQQLLFDDTEKLRDELKNHYSLAANLIIPETKMTQSYMTILATSLNWISYISKVWTKESCNKFSIREWVKGSYNFNGLIIPNDPKSGGLSKSICSSVLSIVVNEKLSEKDQNSKSFWFALDELADLPKTQALSDWLTMGRSKGARTIAGTQNISQLESIYGVKDSETLTSLFSVLISLKIGSSYETASRVSQILGSREVKRATYTHDDKGNQSKCFQKEVEALVRPEDLMQLPYSQKTGVCGYMSVSGWNSVYKLKWPYSSFPNKSEPFIPIQEDSSRGSNGEKTSTGRGARGRGRSC